VHRNSSNHRRVCCADSWSTGSTAQDAAPHVFKGTRYASCCHLCQADNASSSAVMLPPTRAKLLMLCQLPAGLRLSKRRFHCVGHPVEHADTISARQNCLLHTWLSGSLAAAHDTCSSLSCPNAPAILRTRATKCCPLSAFMLYELSPCLSATAASIHLTASFPNASEMH